MGRREIDMVNVGSSPPPKPPAQCGPSALSSIHYGSSRQASISFCPVSCRTVNRTPRCQAWAVPLCVELAILRRRLRPDVPGRLPRRPAPRDKRGVPRRQRNLAVGASLALARQGFDTVIRMAAA